MRTVLCFLLFAIACDPEGFTPPPPPPDAGALPADLELVALSDDGRQALMRPPPSADGLYRYTIVDIATNRVDRTIALALDDGDLRPAVSELLRELGPFHLHDPINGLAVAPDGSFVALASGNTVHIASRDRPTVHLGLTGTFAPVIAADSSVVFMRRISGSFAPSGEPLDRLIAFRRGGTEPRGIDDTIGISEFMEATPTSLRAVHLDPLDRHPCFLDIPYSTLVARRLTCDDGEVERCVFSPSARWVACAMTSSITVRALVIDLESASPPYERVLVAADQLSAVNDRGELVLRSAPGIFRSDDELVVRTRKGLRVEPPR